MADFAALRGWIQYPGQLRKAEALLARWFRWQPSEIDGLPVEEFEGYLKEAGEQIKREYGE